MMLARVCVMMVAGVVGCLAGGCAGGGSLAKRDVHVSLDPAVASGPVVPTIAVQLLGVSERDVGKWEAQNMTAYWAPDSQARREAAGQAREFIFGPGRTGVQTLGASDPIWQTWSASGAQWLVVLANLPGGHEDRPGDADDRRLVIPLDKARWESGQAIDVLVQRQRLQLQTQPKPLKK